MTDDIDSRVDARQRQMEQQQERQQHAENLQRDKDEVAQRKYDPDFFSRIANSDLDSDDPALRGLEERFPATFSNAHLTGVRRETFEERQDLLNRAKAERAIVEHNPGADLRRRPGMHATVRGDRPEISDPPLSGRVDVDSVPEQLDDAQRRVVRGGIREVATTQQSLAVGGTGLRQLTSATSETHRVEHDNEDGGLLSSAMGVFR